MGSHGGLSWCLSVTRRRSTQKGWQDSHSEAETRLLVPGLTGVGPMSPHLRWQGLLCGTAYRIMTRSSFHLVLCSPRSMTEIKAWGMGTKKPLGGCCMPCWLLAQTEVSRQATLRASIVQENMAAISGSRKASGQRALSGCH